MASSPGTVTHKSAFPSQPSSGIMETVKVPWIIDIPPLATPPIDERMQQHTVIAQDHKNLRNGLRVVLNGRSNTKLKCHVASIMGDNFSSAKPGAIQYGGRAHIQALSSSFVRAAFDLYEDLCINLAGIQDIHIVASGSGALFALRLVQLIHEVDVSLRHDLKGFMRVWISLLQQDRFPEPLYQAGKRDPGGHGVRQPAQSPGDAPEAPPDRAKSKESLAGLINSCFLLAPSLPVPRKMYFIPWSAPLFYKHTSVKALKERLAIFLVPATDMNSAAICDIPLQYEGEHTLCTFESAIEMLWRCPAIVSAPAATQSSIPGLLINPILKRHMIWKAGRITDASEAIRATGYDLTSLIDAVTLLLDVFPDIETYPYSPQTAFHGDLTELSRIYDQIYALAILATSFWAPHPRPHPLGSEKSQSMLDVFHERIDRALETFAAINLDLMRAVLGEVKNTNTRKARLLTTIAHSIYSKLENGHGQVGCLIAFGDLSGPSDVKAAAKYWKAAFDLSQGIGDPYLAGLSMFNMGVSSLAARKLGEAENFLLEALELSRRADIQYLQARIWHSLGEISLQRSNFIQAQRRLTQALLSYRVAEGRDIQIKESVGVDTFRILMRNQLYKDKRVSADALPLTQAYAARETEASCLCDLSSVMRGLSAHDEAMRYSAEAQALYRSIKSRDGEAKCLWCFGKLAQEKGNWEEAQNRYQDALEMFHATGNRQGEANMLYWLGSAQQEAMALNEAQLKFMSSLEQFRLLNDRRGQAECLFELASLSRSMSKLVDARALYQEATSLFRVLEDHGGEARCLLVSGRMDLRASNYVEAESQLQAALKAYELSENRDGHANCLYWLGTLFWETSRVHDAELHFSEALALYRVTEHQLGQAESLIRLGQSLSHDSSAGSQARAYFEEALILSRALKDRAREASCLTFLGTLASRSLDVDGTETMFKEALGVYQSLEARFEEADCLYWLGWVSQERSMLQECQIRLDRALLLFKESKAYRRMAETLCMLSETMQRMSQLGEAINCLQFASKLYDAVGDSIGQAESLLALGQASLLESDFSEAESAFSKALSLIPESQDLSLRGACLMGLGTASLRNSNFDSAEMHFLKALDASTLSEHVSQRILCLLWLGNISTQRAEASGERASSMKATEYLKQALDIISTTADLVARGGCLVAMSRLSLMRWAPDGQKTDIDDANEQLRQAAAAYHESGRLDLEDTCLALLHGISLFEDIRRTDQMALIRPGMELLLSQLEDTISLQALQSKTPPRAEIAAVVSPYQWVTEWLDSSGPLSASREKSSGPVENAQPVDPPPPYTEFGDGGAPTYPSQDAFSLRGEPRMMALTTTVKPKNRTYGPLLGGAYPLQ